jgi:hypothetical protein
LVSKLVLRSFALERGRGASAKPSFARSRCTSQGGTNRFRDFDAPVWSARSTQNGYRSELHPPSPSPWKGEGVRQRGSSINQTEHCAIAKHIAGGVQTSFVISMLHFGCCRRSIEYGPRDRHKMVIDPNSIPRPLPLEKGKGCVKEDRVSTTPEEQRLNSVSWSAPLN